MLNAFRKASLVILLLNGFVVLFAADLKIGHDVGKFDLAVINEFSPEKYKSLEVSQKVRVIAEGIGVARSYIFLPYEPQPKKNPLIIFLHGWMGTNPKNFGAIIDHFVRRGAVIIYPVYQIDEKTIPQTITENAGKSIEKAIARLNVEFPTIIDKEKTMFYGFSMGATMALNLAIDAKIYQIPSPKALLLASPGDAHHVFHGELSKTILNHSIEELSNNIPVVIMTGKDDTSIGLPTAKEYWEKLCKQKRLVTLIVWPSGGSNEEKVIAGHGAPGAPDERYNYENIYEIVDSYVNRQESFPVSKSINNIDYYGQWKVMSGFYEYLSTQRAIEWIFEKNDIMSNLGTFKDGSAYPQAYIQSGCKYDN